MKGSSDHTTGLIAALLSSHKDARHIFYLSSAALAADMMLVSTGKPGLASITSNVAASVWGLLLFALILWALFQNMIVPLISEVASSIVGWIGVELTSLMFPDAGGLEVNPNRRLYVALTELEGEIIRQPDAARIAMYEKECQKGDEARKNARLLAHASAGITVLLFASRFILGTVVSALPMWCLVLLLATVSAPWIFFTLDFSMKRRWIVDPELAGRLHQKQNKARKSDES